MMVHDDNSFISTIFSDYPHTYINPFVVLAVKFVTLQNENRNRSGAPFQR